MLVRGQGGSQGREVPDTRLSYSDKDTMTPEEEKKRLDTWKEALWGMWEDGMRLGRRPMNLRTLKDCFYAAFDSGRSSRDIIPKARKAKSKS